MAFFTVNVNHEYVECVLFSDTFKQYQYLLDEKHLVLINGMVRQRNKELQIQVLKMRKL